jgi:hypothetical protein
MDKKKLAPDERCYFCGEKADQLTVGQSALILICDSCIVEPDDLDMDDIDRE